MPSGIVPYTSAFMADVLGLARKMHAESALARIPLSIEKLRAELDVAAVNPNVYLRLWVSRGEVVGGLWGMLTRPYWSEDIIACDRAWFMSADRRGGVAALRLLRDFEAWAKAGGALWMMPGQTTGVAVDDTKRLFENCGYKTVGSHFMKEI